MAFDWKEFLDLAKVLQSSPNTSYPVEAAHRSAVSRAYYAAFCHARNYAEQYLGFQRTKTGRDHGLLRKHLGRQGPDWKEVADELEDLHEWRRLCDYEDVVPHLSIMVASAISTAETIIETMGTNRAR